MGASVGLASCALCPSEQALASGIDALGLADRQRALFKLRKEEYCIGDEEEVLAELCRSISLLTHHGDSIANKQCAVEALASAVSSQRPADLRCALKLAHDVSLEPEELESAQGLLKALEQGRWEENPSGDPQSDCWRSLPEYLFTEAELNLQIFESCHGSHGRRVAIGDGRTFDFSLMTCLKTPPGKGKSTILPIRRIDQETGLQTHPASSRNHPWLDKKISLREKDGDWLNNTFFLKAFSQCLRAGCSDISVKIEDLFDFQYNMDYRGWTGPADEERGGIKYTIPSGWKRFACSVRNRFGDDNSWLRLDGGSGEWAVAYHGTSTNALLPILAGGLKAGGAQAYENHKDARTGQPIGNGVYCTPSMEVALKYAVSRGNIDTATVDGRSVYFVMQCRVRPEAIKRCHDESQNSSAYWVINNPQDIRPYGVLVKARED